MPALDQWKTPLTTLPRQTTTTGPELTFGLSTALKPFERGTGQERAQAVEPARDMLLRQRGADSKCRFQPSLSLRVSMKGELSTLNCPSSG